MKSHIYSLYPSNWDIIEIGLEIPDVDDENYNPMEVEEIVYCNSQATMIVLASLYREEYNKVNGLKSAKDKWDNLKTVHEGDKITKITKRELLERELKRFTLLKREEMEEMYNRLNILVNQVRDFGGKKWSDHEVVKLMLRSFTYRESQGQENDS
jgi:hypothetical protein